MEINNELLRELFIELRRISEHRTKGAEAKIRKIYKQALKDLRLFLGEEYALFSESGKLTYEILQRKGEFARFLEETQLRLDRITPEISKEIEATATDVYTKCYEGMKSAAQAPDLDTAFLGLYTVIPEVIKRAVENPISGLTLKDTLEKNRQQIVYEIKRNLGVGLANGDSVDTMSRRVSKCLDGDYEKAVRVVRTEAHRVRESGEYDGALEMDEELKKSGSGMRMFKTWCTMKDERVRPRRGIGKKSYGKANHIKMDGVSIRIDKRFDLGQGVSALYPGGSRDAGNDIRCRCLLTYEAREDEGAQIYQHEADIILKNDDNSGIIPINNNDEPHKRMAISGALNPDSDEADKHAEKYYNSVRKMKYDAEAIAKNTGWKLAAINKIKNHVFIEQHDLDGEKQRFYPSFEMAASWQSLVDGKNISKRDLILLKHEYLELTLMRRGFTQDQAHIEASRKHNFAGYKEGQ